MEFSPKFKRMWRLDMEVTKAITNCSAAFDGNEDDEEFEAFENLHKAMAPIRKYIQSTLNDMAPEGGANDA